MKEVPFEKVSASVESPSIASEVIVVGHNLDAQRFLLNAVRSNPALLLRWFRTSLDAQFETQAKDFGSPWLLIPGGWNQKRSHQLSKDQAFVFYTPLKRLSLNDFARDAASLLKVHPVLIQKILSIGLGHDLTPRPMGDHHSRYATPDVNWFEKASLTASALAAQDSLCLVPRAQALHEAFEELEELQVKVLRDARVVTGVRPSAHRGEEHQIVHNAPYEATLAQKILWTGMSMPLRAGEGAAGSLFSDANFEFPVARWRSQCAKVPLQQVCALPKFSLWIDSLASKDFLETGRVNSGFLHRIFCIPTADQQRAWLQIDTFEWLGSGHSGKEAVKDPWKILKDLCPSLNIVESVEFSLDENYLFKDPKPRFFRLGRDIDHWFSGYLGDPAQVMNQWIIRNKVDKTRSTIDTVGAP